MQLIPIIYTISGSHLVSFAFFKASMTSTYSLRGTLLALRVTLSSVLFLLCGDIKWRHSADGVCSRSPMKIKFIRVASFIRMPLLFVLSNDYEWSNEVIVQAYNFVKMIWQINILAINL